MEIRVLGFFWLDVQAIKSLKPSDLKAGSREFKFPRPDHSSEIEKALRLKCLFYFGSDINVYLILMLDKMLSLITKNLYIFKI